MHQLTNMGIKRRNKISAEFSMSSLTDIIFLLLIFFMLTSTLVKIQPFDLPRSDSKTVAPISVVVSIDKSGRHMVNDNPISVRALERALRYEVSKVEQPENYTVTIVAETGTSFDYVINIMQIASRLRVKAIIATQPREG